MGDRNNNILNFGPEWMRNYYFRTTTSSNTTTTSTVTTSSSATMSQLATTTRARSAGSRANNIHMPSTRPQSIRASSPTPSTSQAQIQKVNLAKLR